MKASTYISDTLFDLSPTLLCFLDLDGYFLKVNPALINTLGYPEEELLAKPFLAFVNAEYREETRQQLAALANKQPIHQFKNCYTCADGSLKWLCWNAVQLPDQTCFASANDITIYKEGQKETEKSSNTIRQIFDFSPDVICLFDDAGRFVQINKAGQLLWGYDENEVLGKHYLDFVHPDDREHTLVNNTGIRLGTNQTNFQNRTLCKNGSYLLVSWSVSWLPNEELIFGVARVTTEKQEWKEQLLLNEHRLLALIESGNDIILILSAEGVYKFVSPSVKNILNSEPSYYLGKVTFQFIHPDDLEWVGNQFKSVLETDKPVYIPPFRLQIASGEWVWIETVATNMLKDPAIDGIVINAKDVSRRIKHEHEKLQIAEQVKISNERYSLALKATKDVIWDWNLETNELTRDISFEKLFGYSPLPPIKDQDTYSWENYIIDEDKHRVIASITAAINNPDITYWSEEYRYAKANEAIAYIVDQGYIIRNASRRAVRMVGAMHDVTASKKNEQHILKQQEQLMEVARMNSHELRHPVAALLGLLKLFDKSSVMDQQNREVIERLEITVAQLDKVVQRINDKIRD